MMANDDELGRSGRGDARDNDRTRVASGRNGPNIALIAALVIAAYVIAFFFRNSRHTIIDYVFGESDTTVRWALLMAVALGVLLDRLVSFWWRRSRRPRGRL